MIQPMRSLLRVRVSTGANRSAVSGRLGEAWKIRIAAPPVDGKANSELVRFMAEKLDVPRDHVSIKSGHTSRSKTLTVEGLSSEQVARALAAGGE